MDRLIPRRPLGLTGLHVSVLGFGASPLGGVFHVRIIPMWFLNLDGINNSITKHAGGGCRRRETSGAPGL